MKAVENSKNVGSRIETEEKERIEKLRRVNSIEEIQFNLNYLNKEDKEKNKLEEKKQKELTPQEIFRNQMAVAKNTEIYRRIQENSYFNIVEEKEDMEIE